VGSALCETISWSSKSVVWKTITVQKMQVLGVCLSCLAFLSNVCTVHVRMSPCFVVLSSFRSCSIVLGLREHWW
jgi:hypothetical protein